MDDMFMKSESLRKTITAHPDLPIVFLCDYNICPSEYDWAPAATMQVRVGKILDVPDWDTFGRLFTDEEEDDFEQAVRDEYNMDLKNDDDVEKLVAEEIEKCKPYWKECIIIYLGV